MVRLPFIYTLKIIHAHCYEWRHSCGYKILFWSTIGVVVWGGYTTETFPEIAPFSHFTHISVLQLTIRLNPLKVPPPPQTPCNVMIWWENGGRGGYKYVSNFFTLGNPDLVRRSVVDRPCHELSKIDPYYIRLLFNFRFSRNRIFIYEFYFILFFFCREFPSLPHFARRFSLVWSITDLYRLLCALVPRPGEQPHKNESVPYRPGDRSAMCASE